MKLEIELGGASHTVAPVAADGRVRWLIDGHESAADAVEIRSGVYSILIGGESLEARVENIPGPRSKLRVIVADREFTLEVRDPRAWRRNRGAAAESAGAQQVYAPMPGKIVRVLVNAGDPVTSGQGVAVVEAMKMQNEVRAPKSGKIERVSVAEGQTVAAGDVIAVVS